MSTHASELQYLHIQAQLTALFTERLHVEVPSFETDLLETGILDSLKFVELLLQIEQQFQVQIVAVDLEIESFRSIEKIASVVLRHKNASV